MKWLWIILSAVLTLAILSGCQPGSNQSLPQDTMISLERSVCFGACPAYTITIDANGNVTYDGKEFVAQSGLRESTVSPAALEPLIAKIRDADFFQLEDDYGYNNQDVCEVFATDHPTAIVTVRLNGNTKTVQHYHGCQGFEREDVLYEIEDMIDEISNSAQWIEE